MYSLVAIGFVLIYKTSGVFNFAQGVDGAVRGADLRQPGRARRPLLAGAAHHAGGDGAARLSHRARRAAAAGQPPADHAVHGDARPLLHHRGAGADAVGHAGARARARHRRHAASRSAASSSASSTCSRPASRRRWWRCSACSSTAPASASPCAPSPTTSSRRWRSASPAAHLGRRLGRRGRRRAGRRACSGARASGVQFSLSLIVLKALPVLVLGGFTSIAGAIVGGLIIGATEKLAEVYLGPLRRRRHRELVRLRPGAPVPAGAPDRPVRRSRGREGLMSSHACALATPTLPRRTCRRARQRRRSPARPCSPARRSASLWRRPGARRTTTGSARS